MLSRLKSSPGLTNSVRLDHMKQVNIYEAKTHLSLLIGEALGGEEIIVARNGEPLVRLEPVNPRKPSDAFDMDRGKVWISPDFDKTPDDFEDYT